MHSYSETAADSIGTHAAIARPNIPVWLQLSRFIVVALAMLAVLGFTSPAQGAALGLSGPILDFTNSKDYLSGESDVTKLSEKNSFTIELSFLTKSTGFRQGLFGLLDQPPVYSQFQSTVFVESNGAPCFEVCVFKSYCRRVSADPVKIGEWHSLKAHYDASNQTMTLMVDGKNFSGPAKVASKAPSNGTFRIGTDFHSNFDGQIKDFDISR